MLGKDDRSKDKRKKMKQIKQSRRGTTATTTSSSSPPGTAKARSIVDIADSSDEPRFNRKVPVSAGGGNWSSRPSSLAPQRNRDLVDTLPPTDDTDDLQLDINGAPIDENARAQLRAADYQQLSQFPSMGGGHFSFGAEKEWNNICQTKGKEATISQKLFTLNLSLLNSGLKTIPFYKRMDYPTTMFTRQQLQEQNKAAEIAENLYQQRVLREANAIVGEKSRVSSAKEPPVALPASASDIATAAAPVSSQPDELDELLALTDTQLNLTISTPVIQPATPSSNSKTEVEQWLDTVLDE